MWLYYCCCYYEALVFKIAARNVPFDGKKYKLVELEQFKKLQREHIALMEG